MQDYKHANFIAHLAMIFSLVACLLCAVTIYIVNDYTAKQIKTDEELIQVSGLLLDRVGKIEKQLNQEDEDDGPINPAARKVSLPRPIEKDDIQVEETRYQGCSFLIFKVSSVTSGHYAEYVEMMHDPQCKNSSFNHTIIAAHGVGK